jgi:hypothetical protein
MDQDELDSLLNMPVGEAVNKLRYEVLAAAWQKAAELEKALTQSGSVTMQNMGQFSKLIEHLGQQMKEIGEAIRPLMEQMYGAADQPTPINPPRSITEL